MAQKPQKLTLRLDLDTLVEFNVAAKIFRERSAASLLHHHVVSKINEARALVSAEDWTRMVSEQKDETLNRSEMRSELAKKHRPSGIPGATVDLTQPAKRKRTG